MTKVNVLPCPGLDRTSIRPPCRSTIRLQVASPRPTPGGGGDDEGDDDEDGSAPAPR
jgi:hypothetical protein